MYVSYTHPVVKFPRGSVLTMSLRVGLPEHRARRSDREQTEQRESAPRHVCDPRKLSGHDGGAGSDWWRRQGRALEGDFTRDVRREYIGGLCGSDGREKGR